MTAPRLHVIEGGGNVIAYLEGLLEEARRGEHIACVCATLGDDGIIGVGRAEREDVPHPWAMAVAMAAVLQDMLMDGDL